MAKFVNKKSVLSFNSVFIWLLPGVIEVNIPEVNSTYTINHSFGSKVPLHLNIVKKELKHRLPKYLHLKNKLTFWFKIFALCLKQTDHSMKDDKLRSEIETCVIDPEHSDVEHCAVESKENSTHLNKKKIIIIMFLFRTII
jgi:hypothetical protein